MAKKNQELIELIKSTPTNQIAALEPVREKFITNYEQAHGKGKGELAYQKNYMQFQQILSGESFREVSPLAAFKCWIQIAIKGYDLDPTEGEVYIVPYGKSMELQKQAPYLVRRLRESGQIREVKPAQLIFDGDEFEIVEGSKIKSHKRTLKSNKIIAGYVCIITKEGNEAWFFYTPNDWELWRKKSKQGNGENWNVNGQPNPSFLKTKIVLHACKEKCWSSGRTRITEDFFPEVDSEDEAPETVDIEHTEVNIIEEPKTNTEDGF